MSQNKIISYTCQILITSDFLYILSTNINMPNFQKIRQVGAELLHAGGRTDTHDDANSRFPQFGERA
jgi:hypothetical protein